MEDINFRFKNLDSKNKTIIYYILFSIAILNMLYCFYEIKTFVNNKIEVINEGLLVYDYGPYNKPLEQPEWVKIIGYMLNIQLDLFFIQLLYTHGKKD